VSVTPSCFGGLHASLVAGALPLGAATDGADVPATVGLGVALLPPLVHAAAIRLTATSTKIPVERRICSSSCPGGRSTARIGAS
jgi:hypothetical protein